MQSLTVGLSGGADSTLALLVCCRLLKSHPEYDLKAVHCIHGLDADDPIWLAHNQKLCAKLAVRLFTPRLDIRYGGGRSPEEVSRAERYRALIENTSKEHGAIILGHQGSDQVESLLLALKRGSGPRGLSGMPPVVRDSRGTLVRPLLQLSKAEVETLVHDLGFDFVFDISNSYLKFERNFIRLEVLPLLRTRFPGIDGAIRRSAALCAQEHDLALRYAAPVFARHYLKAEHALECAGLDLNDESLCAMLIRLLVLEYTELPPGLALIAAALELMRGSPDQTACLKVDERLCLRRFSSRLYVSLTYELPARTRLELGRDGSELKLGDFAYALKPASPDDSRAFFLPEGLETVTLDFGAPGSLKLKLRHRCRSRELKKLLHEAGVPVWLRGSHPLLGFKPDKGEFIYAALSSFDAVEPRHECEDIRTGPGGFYRLQRRELKVLRRLNAD